MGIGDWGLGIGPNPQSPIPNPQIILVSNYLTNILIYVIIILYIVIYKFKFINYLK